MYVKTIVVDQGDDDSELCHIANQWPVRWLFSVHIHIVVVVLGSSGETCVCHTLLVVLCDVNGIIILYCRN